MFTSAITARQRQFHNQTGAASLTILRINASAGALDDLAGDGKAKTGIPAEVIAGPLGRVETLEDGLQILRRDARTFVLHGDARDDVVAAGRHGNLAALRAERDGIVDQ